MTEQNPAPEEVNQFILEEIDSVPYLEALLMLWNTRPKLWSVEGMAKALYVSPETAHKILQDVAQRGLIVPVSAPGAAEQYGYQSQSADRDALLRAVESTYRRELVRVSTMIHSKASPAVREFARAFRFTKEKDKEKE
jgi:hypothetical protein